MSAIKSPNVLKLLSGKLSQEIVTDYVANIPHRSANCTKLHSFDELNCNFSWNCNISVAGCSLAHKAMRFWVVRRSKDEAYLISSNYLIVHYLLAFQNSTTERTSIDIIKPQAKRCTWKMSTKINRRSAKQRKCVIVCVETSSSSFTRHEVLFVTKNKSVTYRRHVSHRHLPIASRANCFGWWGNC